jgi:hypothetical protein
LIPFKIYSGQWIFQFFQKTFRYAGEVRLGQFKYDAWRGQSWLLYCRQWRVVIFKTILVWRDLIRRRF